MKKILLIYPPSKISDNKINYQMTNQISDFFEYPPIDLMYLASISRMVGVQPKIVDYNLSKNDFTSKEETFKRDLKIFKPDYLLINASFLTLKEDLQIIKTAKKILPNLITIVKGLHFLDENFDILLKNKSLDLIIVGEAEETLKEILQNKKPYSKILGLYYRDNVLVKFSGKRPFIKDLDKLPFPARDLIDNNIYRNFLNNKKQAVIMVSRGCPHHCFFCIATPIYGAKVRIRTSANIISEIKECVSEYNISNFVFQSHLFNCNEDWVVNLCEKIIANGLKINWSVNFRADLISLEMAQIMYKAGCRMVNLGIESGSQFLLDKMGKKITLENVKEIVKIFKKANIKVRNSFILGLPWEDEKTADDTIQFAALLNSDFADFSVATPIPSTRYYNFAIENNLFDKITDVDYKNLMPVMTKTFFLSEKRVSQLYKKAFRKFYLRTKFLFKFFKTVKSFTDLKFALKFLQNILSKS